MLDELEFVRIGDHHLRTLHKTLKEADQYVIYIFIYIEPKYQALYILLP